METFESSFPKDYRKDDIEQILKQTIAGKFAQLICLPGGGKATIMRLLATNTNLRRFHLGEKEKSTKFVYLNLLELTSYDQAQANEFLLHSLDASTKHSKDAFILSKQLSETVSKLTSQNSLILLFDHFDEFQNKLSRSFFQTLRTLRSLAKYKFACVFGSRRDLRELVDPEIRREFYDFFVGNTIYMRLNDQKATDFMISQIESILGQKLSSSQKSQLLAQTAGHTRLTKVCTEIILQENLPIEKEAFLAQPIIRATLFELWHFLTAQEQHELVNIAQNKPIPQNDAVESLTRFELLKPSDPPVACTFTIPLFEQFVRANASSLHSEKISYNQSTKEITKGEEIISDLLSPQENRLLKFLIENQGRIVNREEVIGAVWPETQTAEGISDEAIDQMIFRLRKKIEDEPNNPTHLLTVKGLGFRFQP